MENRYATSMCRGHVVCVTLSSEQNLDFTYCEMFQELCYLMISNERHYHLCSGLYNGLTTLCLALAAFPACALPP